MKAKEGKAVSGLSLVELLITLLLSSIIAVGVVMLWTRMEVTHRQGEARSDMQEQAEFALHLMAKDIRLAGFTGCPEATPMWVTLPSSSWYVGNVLRSGVRGEHTSTQRSVVGLVTSNSDILMVHRIEATHPIRITRQTHNQLTVSAPIRVSKGDILIVRSADCHYILQIEATQSGVSRYIPFISAPNLPNWGAQAQLFPQSSIAYFLRNHALFRKQAHDNAQEMIQNVASLTFEYGVQEDSEKVTYRAMNALSQTAHIISVRVTLIMDAENLPLSVKTFVQTIAVRNQL